MDKILTRKTTSEPTPEVATEATPTKQRKSKLKLQQKCINEIISDKKDINNETFLDCLKYQNVLSLVKDLVSIKQKKNEKLVKNINNTLIDLRK